MNGPSVESQKCIHADLPRLLAELQQLSAKTRKSHDSQRERSKEVGQPYIVARAK